MDQYFKKFTTVLVIFTTTTVFSLGLEWLFPKYSAPKSTSDLWIQFFGGMVQFFTFVVGAPALSFLMFEPSIYGPPGMTSAITFFWGFLFQSNMRAKILDWYNNAVDPTLYTSSSSCSSCDSSSDQ